MIVADDLTGATDSGLQFTALDQAVFVGLDATVAAGPVGAVDVFVVNTDSREWSPGRAGQGMIDVARKWPLAESPLVMKKIDSTLRGNIGPELEGLLTSQAFDAAVVAAAYPANGRVTIDGVHLVHGKPLEQTEFACDRTRSTSVESIGPEQPVRPADVSNSPTWQSLVHSSLPHILQQQMTRRVEHWDLNCIRSGEVQTQMMQGLQRGVTVFSCDGAEDNDLQLMVEQVRGLSRRILWVGSAGLAAALASYIRKGPGTTVGPELVPSRRPLVVAGSRSEKTKQQLQRLQEHRSCSVMRLDSAAVRAPEAVSLRDLVRHGQQTQTSSFVTLLTLDDVPLATQELTGGDGAQALGRVAVQLVEVLGIDGLVLTGGETAVHVCRQLGIQGLHVLGPVEEGIPLCKAYPLGQPLVTKAGGFGSEWALVRAVRCLERGLYGDG